MRNQENRWARTNLLGVLAAVLGTAAICRAATDTVIEEIGMVPRLTIRGAVGVTHEILVATNLDQAEWVVVTNLVVTESPYVFIDGNPPSATRRFYRVRVPPPAGMRLISAGVFVMGDVLNDGRESEQPIHSVQVSAFHASEREVTQALWDDVRLWALEHGYQFDSPGAGKDLQHPVYAISWYDAVKWCNARSEREGRTPAYYTDALLTERYKTGQVNPSVDWTTGYRLPTEAEWEKAARGGSVGMRFPWGMTISHNEANYFSSDPYSYDVSLSRGACPTYADGPLPYTSPVGAFAPNAYGLYDVAGNVFEWCWDWYGAYDGTAAEDPRGPISGSTRVFRGGSWDAYAEHSRVASRNSLGPEASYYFVGFRPVLPVEP